MWLDYYAAFERALILYQKEVLLFITGALANHAVVPTHGTTHT